MDNLTIKLQTLASNHIADGDKNNFYFVSLNGIIQTVTSDFGVAYRHWRGLPRNQESALEDRQYGVICSVEPKEENQNKFETFDDSQVIFKKLEMTESLI